MGNPISMVRDTLKQPDAKNRELRMQQLQILEKMIEGRLDKARHEILLGERGDQEIHSGTIVELRQQIHIDVTEGGQDIAESINKAMDHFFGGELMEGLKGGLQEIVKVGANAILGNSAVGEYEQEDMFIVWSNNALLRCDVFYYRFNFSTKGVIEQTEGATGVLLIKRVIDITKTDPQVLSWAISAMAGRIGQSSRAVALIEEAMEVLEKIAEFQARLRTIEAKQQYALPAGEVVN